MQSLTLPDLASRSHELEAAVDATEGIDHWCSGPDWVLSVCAGFNPSPEPLALASRNGFALFNRYRTAEMTVIGGLEPLWGFAFPLLGPDPAAIAADFVAYLYYRDDWTHIAIDGAPNLQHPTTAAVLEQLDRLGTIYSRSGITCQIAELTQPSSSGTAYSPTERFDAWWQRRSPRFRRNLSRAERALKADPTMEIVDVSNDPNLLGRILAIEAQSWKGLEGSGLTSPDMALTYGALITRLQVQGRASAHIIRRIESPDGDPDRATDLAYILGGIRNRIYRGLQQSYVASEAARSLSHVLQLHQVRLLCHNDLADSYNMGMDMPYKHRWADRAAPTTTLVVARSR